MSKPQSTAVFADTPEPTAAILSDLVGFQSVSARSNLGIVDYITALLEADGFRIRHLPNADRTKASIIASTGPVDRPGVVLSAHTDVVPVTGQDWSSDPFTAEIRQGRIYGRGATDMKGFVASVLSHLAAFREGATATPLHHLPLL